MKSLRIGLILLYCLTASLLSTSERIRYDNYRVYKVTATNRKELELLKQMEDTSDSLIFLDGVHVVDKDVTVVVAPHKVPDFLTILGANEIDYELKETNLQKSLDIDEKRNMARATRDQWSGYQSLDYNYNWMVSLGSKYPHIVTLIEAGKTYEKRKILGVKISYPQSSSLSYPQRDEDGQLKQKPGIFLEAGIHAREWIAPATATYIINALLTSVDREIRDLAEQYDWYIIPHANPDGYVYSHTTDRLWRKTRQPYGTCIGADANRNWNSSWNTVGTSNDPCTEFYAGRAANSEIEVKTLTNFITSLKHKTHLYISLHSFSQYLLYPNGWTPELPKNHKDYEQVFNATIKAISKRYGTIYTGGNIYDAIYPAAGSSIDYVYNVLDILMAYCFELRPLGFTSGGIELAPEQISPTAEETLDGIVAMVNEVKALGYFD